MDIPYTSKEVIHIKIRIIEFFGKKRFAEKRDLGLLIMLVKIYKYINEHPQSDHYQLKIFFHHLVGCIFSDNFEEAFTRISCF